MPAYEIRNCFTKDVVKYGQYGHKHIFFRRKIKQHVSSTIRATLDRGFQLACTIIEKAMKNNEFYHQMQDKNEMNRVSTINKLIELHHNFFSIQRPIQGRVIPLYFSQRQTPGPHRRKTAKRSTYSTPRKWFTVIFDIPYGRKRAVKMPRSSLLEPDEQLCAITTEWPAPYSGPGRDVGKSLRNLPAAPGFDPV